MKLKNKLGDPSVNLSFEGCIIPSPVSVQAIARTGIDMIMLDLEHAPTDPSALHAMICAAQGTDASVLVRPPNHDPGHVKLCLDMGAEGMLFPLVRTAEETAACVAACHYPPKGIRGWGAFVAHSRWDTAPMEYLPDYGDQIVAGFLIETVEAVENIDAILSVEGVDFAFIAPFDLSTSLGISGQFDRPEFCDAVATIEAAALAKGIPLGGGPVRTQAETKAFLEKGYRIVGAFDIFQLKGAAAQMASWVKDA
ncbi:MAG: hypothetical protein JJ894_02185 [Dinoroseobacter sp.]|nr:hypothetical protein [Dinoroseobacter sp.]